jgi:putative FmdB family regulatory protein
MPIYEYECKKCGEKFELRRGFNDLDEEIKCPKCGTKHPKRVLSNFMTGSSGSSSFPSCAPSSPT